MFQENVWYNLSVVRKGNDKTWWDAHWAKFDVSFPPPSSGHRVKFYTGTADIIIENNSSLKDLKKKALSIIKKLKKFKFH